MESTKSLNTADYIVSVIEHLAETDFEVPHCVFYGIPDKYPLDGILDKVLQASQLKYVTKTVITDGNLTMRSFEMSPNPSLLIIQGTAISLETPAFLMKFKPSTRVLLLYYSQTDQVSKYERLLTYLSYYNVVYLDEPNKLPSPDRLFKPSFKRNMRGRPISYCSRFPLPKKHILIKWVEDTATFMNTTAHEHMSLKRINNHFGILLTNVPCDRVLLVPRSPLHVIELLALPFSWHVWTTLILLLISVEVAHLAVPKTFRNEPILMVVCGFERYDLHKADRIEKMALFSLIVLLFFMTRAYETRLLSMMVSRPATRDINTVQDLVESGVRIKSDLLAGNAFLDDQHLKSLVVNSTKNSVLNMDGVHAYMTERFLANLVLPKYYDPEQRMNRYHIMDESVGIAHVGFFLRVRSPLVDVFGHTMTVLARERNPRTC
ncbi:hypothetical protein pipiens_015930 [Culex pipiens pipiens]|uniref:Ionotropic receptor n=1 Tax=Culex pipiens pipiens TaxID=38569 RepID=A0ABD1CND4_CULPP